MCDECAFRVQRILKRASERERKRIIHELDVAYKRSQLCVIPNRGQIHERITPQLGPAISQREQLVL
jgi:hypothetical protein